MYKTAIKPAMVYGAECWAVRKKEERELHTTEMRMLRWAGGKTRLDHVRNVDIFVIIRFSLEFLSTERDRGREGGREGGTEGGRDGGREIER